MSGSIHYISGYQSVKRERFHRMQYFKLRDLLCDEVYCKKVAFFAGSFKFLKSFNKNMRKNDKNVLTTRENVNACQRKIFPGTKNFKISMF